MELIYSDGTKKQACDKCHKVNVIFAASKTVCNRCHVPRSRLRAERRAERERENMQRQAIMAMVRQVQESIAAGM